MLPYGYWAAQKYILYPHPAGLKDGSNAAPLHKGQEKIKWLIEAFGRHGITINKIDDGYHFRTSDDEKLMSFKMSFFNNHFKKFTELINELSIDDFCSDKVVNELRQMLDDNYSDAIDFYDEYSSDRIMTMMEFVRSLKAETDYYISEKTVLMH